MTVDVQLSPTIVPAPRQRCITFDLWHCASGRHATIDAPASFTSGLATDVVVNIPGGQWNCITARDKLHTLRSKSGVLGTVNFQAYDASFVGDLATGGHWLLGGNLNDDNFIDIQDYVRFLQQYLAAPSPNTPCGTLPYHADINGSGTVDVADLSFIQVSMFAGSEAACCPTTVASEGEEIEPLSAVSIKELREKGLGHLGVGDFNGDDVLDLADVEIFLEIQPTFDPLKPDTRVPVLREPLNPGSKSGKPDNDAPRKMSSKSGSR